MAKFIEEDMEERPKELNKAEFMEVNVSAVRDILNPLVHMAEFDPEEDLSELIEKPYADLIMLELFKTDQVAEDTFRDAMKVSVFFFLHSDPNAIKIKK